VAWPWETGAPERQAAPRLEGSAYDALARRAIANATVDGRGGASHTGVRRWRRFCVEQGLCPDRPLDSNASLAAKLHEEWLIIRFVACLVQDTGIKPRTATNYLGAVQGW